MALMGLGPEACCALRWDNIEWDAPHNKDEGKGVLDALSAHRKWQMSAGIGSGLVFTNEAGSLLDPSAVRRPPRSSVSRRA